MSTTKHQSLINALQARLMANVTSSMLDRLQEESLPDGFNSNILKQTREQLARFNREVLRTASAENTYLEREPKKEKLANIAIMIDIMSRIGYEETYHVYSEFVGMVIDLIDSIYFAQTHRKNLHFGKYKAFFELIENEIRADVKKEPTAFIYLQNKKSLAFLLDFEKDHGEIEG